MCLYVPVCLCSYLRVCYIEVHDFLEGTRLVCLSVCHPACAVCFLSIRCGACSQIETKKTTGTKAKTTRTYLPYVCVSGCACLLMVRVCCIEIATPMAEKAVEKAKTARASRVMSSSHVFYVYTCLCVQVCMVS